MKFIYTTKLTRNTYVSRKALVSLLSRTNVRVPGHEIDTWRAQDTEMRATKTQSKNRPACFGVREKNFLCIPVGVHGRDVDQSETLAAGIEQGRG